MIGNNGKGDGNTRKMHHMILNGKKTDYSVLKEMAMVGGGLSQQGKICDLC